MKSKKNFFSIRNCAILMIVLGIFYMIATFVLMAAIGPRVHIELEAEFAGDFANSFSWIYTLTGVLISIAAGGFALLMGVAVYICNRRPGREKISMILGAITALFAIYSLISSFKTISIGMLFPLLEAILGGIIFFQAKKQHNSNKQ